MRSSSGMTKFMTRYLLHGMLRFTKITRTIQQGAMAICNLITDEKYKGKLASGLQPYSIANYCSSLYPVYMFLSKSVIFVDFPSPVLPIPSWDQGWISNLYHHSCHFCWWSLFKWIPVLTWSYLSLQNFDLIFHQQWNNSSVWNQHYG